jgi:hypothetical protein
MSFNNKALRKRLKQIIKEELEVILTNEEVGDFFGEDIQRQLEEDEAKISEGGFFQDATAEESAEAAELAAQQPGEEGGDVYKIATESNAADAADELTGRIPDAEMVQVIQSIEDLLHDPELSQGLSDEQRNELETIYNFIMKGRMGEAADPDEEERARRIAKAARGAADTRKRFQQRQARAKRPRSAGDFRSQKDRMDNP